MLRSVQTIILHALLAEDPPAALRSAIEQANDLTPVERDQLQQLNGDGLRISGLLLKKLRFERLTRGDADLDKLFGDDPDAFMRLFRAYDGATTPAAYFPDEEARQFRTWRDDGRRCP